MAPNWERYALNSLAVLPYDAPMAIARKAGLASAKVQRKNEKQKASGKDLLQIASEGGEGPAMFVELRSGAKESMNKTTGIARLLEFGNGTSICREPIHIDHPWPDTARSG